MYQSPLPSRAARLSSSEGFGRIRIAAQTRPPVAARKAAKRPSGLSQRIVRALARRAERLWKGWQQRREAHQTRTALIRLDDRMLRDLGLDRSEIASFAAGTHWDAHETLPAWTPMDCIQPNRRPAP